MRTINATLLTEQKTLYGNPYLELVIGTTPNTIDVSSYVVAYEYEESSTHEAGLVITLDNSSGYFNSLTGDKAYIVQGAAIELKRGLTAAGTDYSEEMPRCWIEQMNYDYERGQALFVLECIDWRGKLNRHQVSSKQSWTATSATTILEWILTQVSLTRASGTMTALSLDFDISPRERLHTALQRLMRKLPEYLYPGLDAEIKWKDIDAADASVYTFGWNAQHPVLNVEAGEEAWKYNSITVEGQGSATGSATDATQISNVGTRHLTIYDESLTTNAQCTQRAESELDFYEAESTQGTIACRPCHGLELYDVVTIDSPPWGGSNTVGRVVRWSEEWDTNGRWHQVILLGASPDKDPGVPKLPKGCRRRRRARRRRRRSRSCCDGLARRIDSIESGLIGGGLPADGTFGNVPVGGVIMWSGAVADIPNTWQLCDGTNDTPDLRDKFVVGAGTTYNPADTGGEDTSDLSHTHDVGTLVTSSEAHTHGTGSYAISSEAHTHGPGTLATDTEAAHSHGAGTLATDTEAAHTHGAGTYASDSEATHTHSFSDTSSGPSAPNVLVNTGAASYVAHGEHTHTVSGTTGSGSSHSHDVTGTSSTGGSHAHDVTGTSSTGGAHSHTVDSGATASDSHSHTITGFSTSKSHSHTITGATASGGLASHDNRPQYYAIAFIMRVE